MNNFTPSQHWNNHIDHRRSYDNRGPTYLGEWTIQLPREEQNVSSTPFHLPSFQNPQTASDLNGREKLVQQINDDNKKELNPMAKELDKEKIKYKFVHPRSGTTVDKNIYKH
jgi:hypothetical protein|tara:strand:+ start:2231 stop:2566 length:336 start_codon:yes stop_codon:yes gene_type:complete